jgi:hypothetical protein
MPPQRPDTAEMTGVCFIVPPISPVCGPASRNPRNSCLHRVTENPVRFNRHKNVLNATAKGANV